MKDRVFERAQGCWNCIHAQDATEFWLQRRVQDLTKAVAIAMESPRGEEDQRVVNIKRMVGMADVEVACHRLIKCERGKSPTGDPVADLVAHNYLCNVWTARVGASLARAGGKLDKLPEELRDYVDGSEPAKLSDLVDQTNEAKERGK